MCSLQAAEPFHPICFFLFLAELLCVRFFLQPRFFHPCMFLPWSFFFLDIQEGTLVPEFLILFFSTSAPVVVSCYLLLFVVFMCRKCTPEVLINHATECASLLVRLGVLFYSALLHDIVHVGLHITGQCRAVINFFQFKATVDVVD